MLEKFLPLDARLYAYVVEHSLPRDEALLEIERSGGGSSMQMAPEQGALFTVLVGALGAKLAVEVGTFTGYGAACIARGLAPGGRLICCELDPERAALAERNLELAGVADSCEVRVGPALETLRAMPADPVIDFAFIDADKPGYRGYYEELLPRMRTGGLIALDNTLFSGDVVDPSVESETVVSLRELNDFLVGDERVVVALVPFSDGVTFVRKL
jgi:caffeoyl-CoA O-methyltransferase